MTVKELRTLLEKLPDDMSVEVWDDDGSFDVGYHTPIFTTDYNAVVLYSNTSVKKGDQWVKEILT